MAAARRAMARGRPKRIGAFALAIVLGLHFAGVAHACGSDAIAPGSGHVGAAHPGAPDPTPDDCAHACAEARAFPAKSDPAQASLATAGASAAGTAVALPRVGSLPPVRVRFPSWAPTGPPLYLRLLRLIE